MSERYTAILLASLSPRQQRQALAEVPDAQRARLKSLMQQILGLVNGDRAALWSMLDRLRPPECLPDALANWLASTPPEWARLLVRSLEPADRRRVLLEQHWAPLPANPPLPERLHQALAAIAERELPLPGPPPIGVFG